MLDSRRLLINARAVSRLLTRIAAPLLLLGIAVSPQPASAQIIYGAIHGTVTDPTGAAVPGAAVSVANTSTGITTTAKTDSHGYYIFPQLQIGGPYRVEITATGFEKFSSTGLMLDVNANREVSAQLQVGSAVQTVSVEAAAVQVKPRILN